MPSGKSKLRPQIATTGHLPNWPQRKKLGGVPSVDEGVGAVGTVLCYWGECQWVWIQKAVWRYLAKQDRPAL